MSWRDLFAANQAVIARHLPASRGPAPRGPVATLPPIAPHATAGLEAFEHRPGGAQRWYIHRPAGIAHARPVPLLVMLHGCTQTAEDFALATTMNQAADRHGFAVLYPQQGRAANQRGCWNWFEAAHQGRAGGEPAAIAGAVRALMVAGSPVSVDPARVFVAGLSAGGAMATVLAATHPDLFAGVAVHSGLAFRSATTMGAALAAMARGGPDPEREGRAAAQAMGADARPVPALVLHGTQDRVVAPVNGEQAAAQWVAINRLAAAGRFRGDPRRPTDSTGGRAPGERSFTRRCWDDDDGRPLVEHLSVEGLGHAWSGGTATARHSDPRGPSATEAICGFFARAERAGGREVPFARVERRGAG